MATPLTCSICERRIYLPLDDDDFRCAGCVRREERKVASSSAVRDGFWDRTQGEDR